MNSEAGLSDSPNLDVHRLIKSNLWFGMQPSMSELGQNLYLHVNTNLNISKFYSNYYIANYLCYSPGYLKLPA